MVSHISEKNPNEIIGGYPVLAKTKNWKDRKRHVCVIENITLVWGKQLSPWWTAVQLSVSAICNFNLNQLVFACITALCYGGLCYGALYFYSTRVALSDLQVRTVLTFLILCLDAALRIHPFWTKTFFLILHCVKPAFFSDWLPHLNRRFEQ